jgi:hypothetical protein
MVVALDTVDYVAQLFDRVTEIAPDVVDATVSF